MYFTVGVRHGLFLPSLVAPLCTQVQIVVAVSADRWLHELAGYVTRVSEHVHRPDWHVSMGPRSEWKEYTQY